MLRDRVINRGQIPKVAPKPAGPPAKAAGKPVPGPKPEKIRATVTGACGHPITFKVKPNPPREEQEAAKRLVKCQACIQAEAKERRKRNPGRRGGWRPGTSCEGTPTRLAWGYEVDVLPVGAEILLTKVGPNRWTSALRSGEVAITNEAVGPRRQIARLAVEYAVRMGIIAPKSKS